MRQLRWKNQYKQGEKNIDQQHKRFLGCFNQLLNAANQREHCQEMEEFLSETGTKIEAFLNKKDAEEMLPIKTSQEFYTHIVQNLPLHPYGSTACRKCGLCDLAQANISEHLQSSVDCLQHSEHQNVAMSQ